MTRYNAQRAVVDDCQDELRTAADYIRDPEFDGVRPDFCEGIGLEIARIQALAAPFAPALSALLASFNASDKAGMQRAFEDIEEAATAFYTIRTLARCAGTRLAFERRRRPRVRG